MALAHHTGGLRAARIPRRAGRSPAGGISRPSARIAGSGRVGAVGLRLARVSLAFEHFNLSKYGVCDAAGSHRLQ